tara:strand:+ start:24611 stop:25759 length:1149 start_codon:yes stop_codon:yes gene_type:complete
MVINIKFVNILILFTYGMSFKAWDESGLLDREIKIYNKISELHDINYTFLTFGDSKDLQYGDLLTNASIYPIYNTYKFFNNKIIRFLYSFYISYSLRKEFANINLIKTNQLMGSWIGIVLKIFNKTPLIVRTGYDIFIFSLKNKKGIAKSFFYYLLTQTSLIFCNLYLVSSDEDKKFIQTYFLANRNKLKVFSNWVEFTDEVKPLAKRYKNKILSVGRLETQKNFGQLITLLKNSSIEVDIYGEGSLKSELTEIAKKNNVKINFLGGIPNSDLLKKMEDYRIFCLLSNFEGNPKVILEAMSKGCVCIVSDIPNNTEIISNNKNGYIVENENAVLQSLLAKLMIDNDKLSRLSNQSRETIYNNFSFDYALELELQNYTLFNNS